MPPQPERSARDVSREIALRALAPSLTGMPEGLAQTAIDTLFTHPLDEQVDPPIVTGTPTAAHRQAAE